MAIKTYKPTTPSRRHMTVSAFEGIDKKAKPERALTEVLKKHAGRNSYGRPPPRRRQQAEIPHHRLQAQQRGQGHGHQSPVRPQPVRQHCADRI